MFSSKHSKEPNCSRLTSLTVPRNSSFLENMLSFEGKEKISVVLPSPAVHHNFPGALLVKDPPKSNHRTHLLCSLIRKSAWSWALICSFLPTADVHTNCCCCWTVSRLIWTRVCSTTAAVKYLGWRKNRTVLSAVKCCTARLFSQLTQTWISLQKPSGYKPPSNLHVFKWQRRHLFEKSS